MKFNMYIKKVWHSLIFHSADGLPKKGEIKKISDRGNAFLFMRFLEK